MTCQKFLVHVFTNRPHYLLVKHFKGVYVILGAITISMHIFIILLKMIHFKDLGHVGSCFLKHLFVLKKQRDIKKTWRIRLNLFFFFFCSKKHKKYRKY